MNNHSSSNQQNPIKHTAKKPVKIGVVAKIKADVVGSAVCKPLKNDHCLINTPKTPREITAGRSDLFTRLLANRARRCSPLVMGGKNVSVPCHSYYLWANV
jgi:hypothetical protein